MLNICMCGAQAGYPHDPLCPYPYYGGDVKKESAWMDAWREKKIQNSQAEGSFIDPDFYPYCTCPLEHPPEIAVCGICRKPIRYS